MARPGLDLVSALLGVVDLSSPRSYSGALLLAFLLGSVTSSPAPSTYQRCAPAALPDLGQHTIPVAQVDL